MSEPIRYAIAIAGFIDGDFHLKAVSGEHLVLSMGPAQIVSAKRELDRYIAHYEATEVKAKG